MVFPQRPFDRIDGDQIGPLLIGLEKPVQIVQTGGRVGDVVTLAAMAAYELDRGHRDWAESH